MAIKKWIDFQVKEKIMNHNKRGKDLCERKVTWEDEKRSLYGDVLGIIPSVIFNGFKAIYL